jgi:hypothetical protein
MTTYILGAGASAHARYPLARDLGTSLREWLTRNKLPNPMWAECIEKLHELYGGLANFEQILTDLMECPPGSPASELNKSERPYFVQSVRVCIPEFFDDVRRSSAPLYERLAREKIQDDDVVITFNYDIALERELKRAALWEIGNGYGFGLGIDGLPPSRVTVLKLHGSTNWLLVPFDGMTGVFQFNGPPLGERPRIRGSHEFEYLGYPSGVSDPLWPASASFPGMPAYILPVLNKNFKELEQFWDSLWDQAVTAVQSSERLVVIGYSMPEADERARKLILNEASREAQVSVCCGGSSDTICEQFRSLGFQHVESKGSARFQDFLGVSQASSATAK